MDSDRPDRENTPARKAIPLRGWKIRFDAPPDGPTLRHAEAGDILALFRAWSESEPEPEDAWDERRAAERYVPAETRAWVGWWMRGSFQVANARIVNLSKTGALVLLDTKPTSSQPVWICLGTPEPVDFVQARVQRVEGEHAPFPVRLEFHSACPPSFFLAAGFGHEGA